ncbi:MAG: hypothetical protein AB1733_22880 [Thermodesulfobacteriota bacterium]
MWRRIAVTAAILALCLPGASFAKKYPHFDSRELQVRNLLLEAFQSASPYHRETKLKEVLKLDPDNYQALVKLGELEMGREGKGSLKANEYFLQAALAQPHRPEAYLALAQSYFQMGYEPEGRDYLMKALSGGQTRLTYEAIALEGQNYLDTANYYAAVTTYADAALSKSSPWRNDPHLLRKLYQAATLSDAPTFWVWKSSGMPAEGVGNVYWIPYVFAKLLAGETNLDEDAVYREFLKVLRQQVEKLREINPKLSPRAAEKWINVILYPRLMAALRQKIGERETVESVVQDRFALSEKFFDFGVCNQEKTTLLGDDLNLYEVFLEASIKDPNKRKEWMDKLYKMRDEALAHVKGIEDPRKRGEELFKWLRENLIVKYDAVDGITAEGVVDKKKYLCLTGAILYTLIGRDAGLNVSGYLRPNHAFAVMYDKAGNRINVETTGPVKDTPESPTGFDIPDENIISRGTDLRGRAAAEGETTPLDLVSYQFTNVGLNKVDQLMFNKYRDQLVDTLKEEGLDQSQINRLIEIWRHAGAQGQKMMAVALMSMKYPQFHAEMSTAIDEALDTFAQARAFNPFNIEFLNVIENMAEGYTKLALARPSSSMLERLRAAREKERAELRNEVQEQMRSEAEAEAERAKKKPEKEKKEAEKEKASAANKKSVAEKGNKEKKQETKPAATEEEPSEIRSYDKEEGASVVEGTGAEATPYQTRQEWPKERAFWLDSLKRLERLAKRHPCSERLRTTLLEHSLLVADVLTVAKRLNVQLDADNKMDYDVLVDELIRIRTEFFDTQPEMASRLSTKISQIL